MEEPIGFTFAQYTNENMPIAKAGIIPGTVITGINKQKVTDFQQFSDELAYHRSGEQITVSTKDKEYKITLAENPDNPKKHCWASRISTTNLSRRNNIGRASGRLSIWY